MDGMSLTILAILGLTSGLVMSLVGASAVMIIVPGLNIVLGYSIHVAIGVSLLVDVLASIAVGYTYWSKGNVEIKQGLWIALGSIIGAQLGAGCTVIIPSWIIALSYGIWMIAAGVTIWKKGLDRTFITERFAQYLRFESQLKRVAVALTLGFIIGVNCGIFGAGGGVLIMLVLIFVLDYKIHSAIGTSTIIMAITAASATLGYLIRGNIDLFASIFLAVGTIVGGITGANLANKTNEAMLAKIVGGIFIALGIGMSLMRLI